MVSVEYDVVVAYGVVDELLQLLLVFELYDRLSAASLRRAGVGSQLSFGNIVLREVAVYFQQCDIAFSHLSAYAYAYSRLEVRVEVESVDHVEWHGAVCEGDLCLFVVYSRRVGHKSSLLRQCLRHHHRQHGRYIAFACCNDAFCVESCQSPTSRIVYSVEQVKASQCECSEAVLLYERF